MHFKHVCLHEFDYVLPPQVITSSDIEKDLESVYQRLKLPFGRLELMTGITERRFWDSGTRPSEAAAKAGSAVLEKTGIPKNEIECLIFTSVSRDMLEPASAAFVHSILDLPDKCLIFDLSNACLGFMNGMLMLANMIELGQVKKGMIVAGETAENLVQTTINNLLADETLTRKSIKPSFASMTIGSGAVALIMGDERIDDTGHRLVGGTYHADTSQSHLCRGDSNNTKGILMATDSEELLFKGVATAKKTWASFVSEIDWQADSIDRFFCHQVGRAHAKLLFETLDLDPARNFETLPFLGNVGSVSAPVTMAMGIEKGELLEGQRGALLGIGSGINCMMLGIDW